MIESEHDEEPTGYYAWLADVDLDTDESKARAAASFIGIVLGEFHQWLITLEDATKALEVAAPKSKRANAAHEQLVSGLESSGDVVLALAEAQDALDFRWHRQPTRQSP
jgi:hypothetical protein